MTCTERSEAHAVTRPNCTRDAKQAQKQAQTGPRDPDEAGVPLESEMARNHRSVKRSFNRPGTRAKSQHRGEGGRPGRGDGRERGETPDEHPK